jgi:hypothetical protein
MKETMNERAIEIRNQLKAPRVGAIAGIVCSIMLIISLALIRVSVPAPPGDAGNWLSSSANSIGLALNLLPVAGIAFMWFIGVLRDRIGAREEQFFAAVFLAGGLLFLAAVFARLSGLPNRNVQLASPGEVDACVTPGEYS